MKYPQIDDGEDSARPFRLWDAKAEELLRWRWYKYPRNAHLGALLEARWAKPGTTIEVIDIRTARLIGQYTRTPTSVQFHQIKRENDGKE